MLTEMQVDGFKSFKNFKMEIRRGLNIIAGPNGSGKTNIIKFMEFIANLSSGSLVEAVSRSGGAGAIFRQSPKGGITTNINLCVSGETVQRSPQHKSQDPLKYTYKAEIVFSLESNVVFFSRQSIQLETMYSGALTGC